MGRVHGERSRGPIQLRAASVQIPLSAWAAAWLGHRLGAGLRSLFGHPLVVGALVVIAAGAWLLPRYGTAIPATVLAAITGTLIGWRIGHAESFHRFVGWPWRGAWRHRLVYRRGWQPAMVTCGLAVRVNGREFIPALLRVSSTATVDRVRVRMLSGQVPEDYAEMSERLARTFGAAACRVRTDPAHRDRVILWLLVADPLHETVPPQAIDDPPNLSGLPVGLQEDGPLYRLRLLGTHLLLVGATGAGKSSVVWAIVHALAPGIGSGLVQLWVCDPKGGMELAPGRALFTRFCHGDDPDKDGGATDSTGHEVVYAELLEDAVHVMRARQARLRGVTRLHNPSPEEPLIVVVVDELASLTSYVTDRDAKKRIAAALSLLLSQGRAVGVTVVAALQDPRKEVLPARDLFPTRIGLRMVDGDQVDMVLGEGAKDRGARCDQIPESLPGVGFVALDGVAEPVRVRFAHLADPDIADLAATHPAPACTPDSSESSQRGVA
jgi:DNA segregation ATPase FtsK/SpoIIIE, S-DNA-T family